MGKKINAMQAILIAAHKCCAAMAEALSDTLEKENLPMELGLTAAIDAIATLAASTCAGIKEEAGVNKDDSFVENEFIKMFNERLKTIRERNNDFDVSLN